MPEEIYKLKDNPSYNSEIRALQDTDPAHATTVFNPLFEAILNNIHYLYLEVNKLQNRTLSSFTHGELIAMSKMREDSTKEAHSQPEKQ